jgi:hypothetical protein
VLAPALPGRSSPEGTEPVASAKQNIGWKPYRSLNVGAAFSSQGDTYGAARHLGSDHSTRAERTGSFPSDNPTDELIGLRALAPNPPL